MVSKGSFLPKSYRNPPSLPTPGNLLRQPSISSLSTGKRRKGGVQRSVSFNAAGPAIQRIDSVRSLLLDLDGDGDDNGNADACTNIDKEMNQIWYDQLELETAKHENAHLVEVVQNLSEDDVQQKTGDSIRGLEHRTEEGSWQAFQNRVKALGAVLDVTTQVDADELASLASEATEDARFVAQQRAVQDAKEAEEYLSDVRDSFLSLGTSLSITSSHSMPTIAVATRRHDDDDSGESIASEFTTDSDLDELPLAKNKSKSKSKSKSNKQTKTPVQRAKSMPLSKPESEPPLQATPNNKATQAASLAESVKKLKHAKLKLQQQQQQQQQHPSSESVASEDSSAASTNTVKQVRSSALKSRILKINETPAAAPPSLFASAVKKKKKNVTTRTSQMEDLCDENNSNQTPSPDHDGEKALGKSDSCVLHNTKQDKAGDDDGLRQHENTFTKECRPSQKKEQIMKMKEKQQSPPFGSSLKVSKVEPAKPLEMTCNDIDKKQAALPDHDWQALGKSDRCLFQENAEKKEHRPSQIKEQIMKMNEKQLPPPFGSPLKLSNLEKATAAATPERARNDGLVDVDSSQTSDFRARIREMNVSSSQAPPSMFAAATKKKKPKAGKAGRDDSHIDVRRSSDSRLYVSSEEEDELTQRASTGSVGIKMRIQPTRRSSRLGGKKTAADALKEQEETNASLTNNAKMKARRCESLGDKEQIADALESDDKQVEAKGTSRSKKSAKAGDQPVLDGCLAVIIMMTSTQDTETSSRAGSATSRKKTIGERSRSMSNLSTTTKTNKYPSNSKRATVQRLPRRRQTDSEEEAPAKLPTVTRAKSSVS